MAITVNDQNHYIVKLPEYNIVQGVNPDTGAPFQTETEAQNWEDNYKATVQATKQAIQDQKQAALQNKRIAQVTLDKTVAAPGESITGSVSVVDGLGNATSDVQGPLYLPVRDANGLIEKVLHIDFTDSAATKTFSFGRSGIYTVTPGESDGGVRLDDPVTVTVAE
jgi:hypothetical protein